MEKKKQNQKNDIKVDTEMNLIFSLGCSIVKILNYYKTDKHDNPKDKVKSIVEDIMERL